MISEGVILKPYTTFRCGGPAKYFAEPSSEEEIKELLSFAKQKELPVLILGLGSNMLISDNGFDGLVIRIGRNMSEITFEDRGEDYVEIDAQAGAPSGPGVQAKAWRVPSSAAVARVLSEAPSS